MHPYDEWELEAQEAQKKFAEQCIKDTSLVYQVFSTEAGKLLLERWKDILLWTPSAHAGSDMISIGMSEGQKHLIRAILYAIKTHEEIQ